jgi:plastocyanin domain-containing protein
MQIKVFIITLFIGAVLFGGVFLLLRQQPVPEAGDNNVAIVEDTQIIEITAKGGYLPRVSSAKAGLPTVIRFNTRGTFDCSSAIRIPSLNITKNLPPSGATDISLGTPQVGTLQGSCGMGMYPFEIQFN